MQVAIFLGMAAVFLALAYFFWTRRRERIRARGWTGMPEHDPDPDGVRAVLMCGIAVLCVIGMMADILGETATKAFLAGAVLAWALPHVVRWWKRAQQEGERLARKQAVAIQEWERQRPQFEKDLRERQERKDLSAKMPPASRAKLRQALLDRLGQKALRRIDLEGYDDKPVRDSELTDPLGEARGFLDDESLRETAPGVDVRRELVKEHGHDIGCKIWLCVYDDLLQDVESELANAATAAFRSLEESQSPLRGIPGYHERLRGLVKPLLQEVWIEKSRRGEANGGPGH